MRYRLYFNTLLVQMLSGLNKNKVKFNALRLVYVYYFIRYKEAWVYKITTDIRKRE